MNKKVIGFAVAASLVAPMVAQADVTVTGAVQAELGFQSDETGGAVNTGMASLNGSVAGADSTTLTDNARGRVTIKAKEKLGDTGLTGVALIEYKLDTTLGGAPNGNREAMVGLKGGFGMVSGGALKPPYKYAGGVKYDAFVTTLLEARSNGGMSGKVGDKTTIGNHFGHNAFFRKAIGYNSPKMGGLQAKVNYRLDEGGANGELAGAYSLSVMYSAGGIEGFLAATDTDDPATVYSAIKVGGKFKSGAFSVMGQYEMIDNNNVDETILYLGGRFKMGKTTLVGQFGMSDTDGVGDGTTYIAVGAWHKFTKKTGVYAGYRMTTDVDSVFSVGMRKAL